MAARVGVKVAVLDRANPIGGEAVEGNVLRPEWASFVGPYPLPMRHGFTLGELARYYRATQQIDCDLEVVPLQGWHRGDHFDATGLPWVLPSPNLPTLDGALVYPGQVLLEGTNLSEGRGTTRPFELWGAPFLEPTRILSALPELPGVVLRPACFEPTFHKWAGELCRGQVLVERICNRDRCRSLVLIGNPRVHLVEVIRIVQVVAEHGEHSQLDDDAVGQLAREVQVESVVHRP